jgi:hypothetical protein
MIFFFEFIKNIIGAVVVVSNHSVDVFKHLKKDLHTFSFYITSIWIEGGVS